MKNSVLLVLLAACISAANVFVRGLMIPSPLSEKEQKELILLHNEMRSGQPNQINMQCIKSTDPKLVELAQTAAESCEPYSTAFENLSHGVAWAVDYANSSDVAEYVQEAQTEMGYYDYGVNGCSDLLPQCTLSLFRQAAWFEGGKMGCGRAHCDGTTHFVCVYEHKQNPHQRPYLSIPDGEPCLACPSLMECKEDLCCPAKSPTTQSAASGLHLVPLANVFNRKYRRQYLVSNPAEVDQNPDERIQKIGTFGKVATERDAVGCPQMQPIHRMFDVKRNFEVTAVSAGRIEELLGKGWRDMGIVGYAVPEAGLCGASTPVYEAYNPALGFIQMPSENFHRYVEKTWLKFSQPVYYVW